MNVEQRLSDSVVNVYTCTCRNLPRAIWIAMPSVTFIYVMSNIAYFAVLSPIEIMASDAVAVVST